MSTSPIDDLLAWFGGLPVSHRQDIAALVSAATPGFQAVDPWHSRDLAADFVAIVQTLRKNRYAEVGLALALRSSIQFLIIDKRSTRDLWRQTADALDMAAQHDKSGAIATNARELEFRAEQWIKTCDKWSVLRSDSLTDASLNAFLNAASGQT